MNSNTKSLSRKFETLIGVLREQGLKGGSDLIAKNVRYRYWLAENRWFDWRHNVDTGGRVDVENLAVRSENLADAVRYEPTPIRTFAEILSRIPGRHEDFTFVDYGSGKGRVLLLAAQFQFRAIVGVEFSGPLHMIAERNLRSSRGLTRRCNDVRSVNADATTFEPPPTPCIFYFCQPFGGAIMASVLQRIRESLEKNPRKAVLAFLLPHPSLDRAALLQFTQRVAHPPLPASLAWQYQPELEIYSNFSN